VQTRINRITGSEKSQETGNQTSPKRCCDNWTSTLDGRTGIPNGRDMVLEEEAEEEEEESIRKTANISSKICAQSKSKTEKAEIPLGSTKKIFPSKSSVSSRVLNTIVAGGTVTRNVIRKLTRGDFNATGARALPPVCPPVQSKPRDCRARRKLRFRLFALHIWQQIAIYSCRRRNRRAACRRIGTSATCARARPRARFGMISNV